MIFSTTKNHSTWPTIAKVANLKSYFEIADIVKNFFIR